MNKNLKLIKIVCWVYMSIVGSYCIYGLATEHGFYGYLIDLQLRQFGSANVKITALVMIFVLMIPIMPLLAYSNRKDRSMPIGTGVRMTADPSAEEPLPATLPKVRRRTGN